MADWSNLKVTELKEELKSRGVPLTGLKLKQQMIDKLVELDGAINATIEESQEEPILSAKPDDALDSPQGQPTTIEQEEGAVANIVKEDGTEVEDKSSPLPEDLPVNINGSSHSQGSEAESTPVKEENLAVTTDDPPEPQQTTESKMQTQLKDTPIQASRASELTPESTSNPITSTTAIQEVPFASAQAESISQPLSATSISGESSPTSILAADILEDSRKRKRRSVTPVPDEGEIAKKKAKASDGTSIVLKPESSALEEMQEATETSEAIRTADGLGDADGAEEISRDTTMLDPLEKPLEPVETLAPEEQQQPERDISPAIHSATRSLYMRNFKRPLQVQALRNHVSKIATLSSSSSSDDPVSNFYLDSIRTHAFVTFTSIPAASRVRNAMHDTRFPDETIREPLFVDFVPDEDVQPWIEEEIGAVGGGRGGSSKRFEIVYHTGLTGEVEAILRDVNAPKDRSFSLSGSGPAPAAMRSQVPPRESFNQARFGPAPTPEVHPDRLRQVSLLQRDSSSKQEKERHIDPHSPPSKGSNGTGFLALDSLFPSTTSKPKLYYKPVTASVAEGRLAMIKNLQPVNRGRSGEVGMKRYSFEKIYGSAEGGKDRREEWVDKGPEFGFGRKGVDRLEGRAGQSGYGGYRGGGGGGGGRGGGRFERPGGDSWRGSGR